jgi:hypothetical protein
MQLFCHLIGDFWLQTDKMALNKKKNTFSGYYYCLLHCLLYSLPFLFIATNQAVLWIFISHFIIDKWDLVGHMIQFKNGTEDTKNFGFEHDRPFPVTIWLYIIHDNSLHIILNYLIITSL